MTSNSTDVTGLILAGGKAQRMGGNDKGLTLFKNEPVAVSIAHQLAKQCGTVLINANRNRGEYGKLGYRVIPDTVEGFQGPLAGMYAGLESISSRWMISVPCDGPWIASDYVHRMQAAAERGNYSLAVAKCDGRLQPVHALIERSMLESLRAFLRGKDRKIDRWFVQHEYLEVDFSDYPRMFQNFNTPEQLREMC